MKSAALIFMLLLIPLAGATTDPTDYPVTVHVSSSRFLWNTGVLEVDAVIDGKKYLLVGPYNGVLSPGDYKAKLVKDEHKTSYDTKQTYEFLFPDNKTRNYDVVGQSE
jgi:hypothetical protein